MLQTVDSCLSAGYMEERVRLETPAERKKKESSVL
jgi:hypothetical protein